MSGRPGRARHRLGLGSSRPQRARAAPARPRAWVAWLMEAVLISALAALGLLLSLSNAWRGLRRASGRGRARSPSAPPLDCRSPRDLLTLAFIALVTIGGAVMFGMVLLERWLY